MLIGDFNSPMLFVIAIVFLVFVLAGVVWNTYKKMQNPDYERVGRFSGQVFLGQPVSVIHSRTLLLLLKAGIACVIILLCCNAAVAKFKTGDIPIGYLTVLMILFVFSIFMLFYNLSKLGSKIILCEFGFTIKSLMNKESYLYSDIVQIVGKSNTPYEKPGYFDQQIWKMLKHQCYTIILRQPLGRLPIRLSSRVYQNIDEKMAEMKDQIDRSLIHEVAVGQDEQFYTVK